MSQTLPPLEVIVVDDASTDRTVEVVRGLAEAWPSIRLLSLPENKGPSAARNAAIDVAAGDWIAILDADDAWEPERLQVLTRLGEELGADFVADNLILFDHAVGREGSLGFLAPWKCKRLTFAALFASAIPEARFSYGLLKPLFRRASQARMDLRYDEGQRYGEDLQFYAEALLRGASFWVTSAAYYISTTRFGEFSGTRSPHSRSTPRFDQQVEVNDRFLARLGPDEPELRRILVHRSRRLMAVHRANVARQYRLARQWIRYAAYVLLHFDLLLLLIERTVKRATGRFNARPLAT